MSRKQRTRGRKGGSSKVEAEGESEHSAFLSGLPYECDESQVKGLFPDSSISSVLLPKY